MVVWDFLHQKPSLGASQPNPVDWLISTASEWLVGIFRFDAPQVNPVDWLGRRWGAETENQEVRISLSYSLTVCTESILSMPMSRQSVQNIFTTSDFPPWMIRNLVFLLGWLKIWWPPCLGDWEFGFPLCPPFSLPGHHHGAVIPHSVKSYRR